MTKDLLATYGLEEAKSLSVLLNTSIKPARMGRVAGSG